MSTARRGPVQQAVRGRDIEGVLWQTPLNQAPVGGGRDVESRPRLPPVSVAAAFGHVPTAQANILSALLAGRDLRAWDRGVRLDALLRLEVKGLVTVTAATNRITFTPPVAAALRRWGERRSPQKGCPMTVTALPAPSADTLLAIQTAALTTAFARALPEVRPQLLAIVQAAGEAGAAVAAKNVLNDEQTALRWLLDYPLTEIPGGPRMIRLMGARSTSQPPCLGDALAAADLSPALAAALAQGGILVEPAEILLATQGSIARALAAACPWPGFIGLLCRLAGVTGPDYPVIFTAALRSRAVSLPRILVVEALS